MEKKFLYLTKEYYGCGGAVLAACTCVGPAKDGYNIASSTW